MRAVKAIIMAAGNLKRSLPDEDEDLLIVKAISDCNLPKFTSKDVSLFDAIIADLFPTINRKSMDYGELENSISQVS